MVTDLVMSASLPMADPGFCNGGGEMYVRR